MHTASCLAGMAFSNALLGIVHSMAHQLGAVYDTPHGVANAILLPTVMRFNGVVCADRFREILCHIGRPDAKDLNDQDVINTFVWMIEELSKSVGVTQRVSDVGCKEEDLEMLADKAMEDPCKPGNPREVTKEDFVNKHLQTKAISPTNGVILPLLFFLYQREKFIPSILYFAGANSLYGSLSHSLSPIISLIFLRLSSVSVAVSSPWPSGIWVPITKASAMPF